MFGYNEKNRVVWRIAGILIALVLAGGFICCVRAQLPNAINHIANLISPPYKGPVKVVSSRSGWGLTVGGRPFFVKGVCYRYTEIGRGPGYNMYANINKPWLVDGALMKRMGVNAVRIYGAGTDIEGLRVTVRDMFGLYGIKTALGFPLGSADSDYGDPEFRARARNDAVRMVNAYKDEDGILFWIIGDDAREPLSGKAGSAGAGAYYTLANEIAEAVKAADPDHPVVMGVGGIGNIAAAKDLTPAVDILGGVDYGGESFGAYFQDVKANFGKPNVFIEFGADRYDAAAGREAQNWQAAFLTSQWGEVEKNRAPAKAGVSVGNSLGGFVFEWTDQWWGYDRARNAGWRVHDAGAALYNAAYHFDAKAGRNMNDEWWGVVALDPSGKAGGVERRVPTEAYYALRALWTTPLERALYAAGDFIGNALNRVSDIFTRTADAVSGMLGGSRAPSGPVKVAEKPDGWTLTVGGKPYFVKGVCYHLVEIGKNNEYDMFADKARPWITDGAMMKKMGVNTVRFYQGGRDVRQTRAAIRDLYEKYGIKTALGSFLRFWDWPPVNYGDPETQEKIKADIVEMVSAYKDEPGILFWILGNENNYSFDLGVRAWSTPATESLPPLEARREMAKIYYSFINDLAKTVKSIDPNHPVVMGNGEIATIDVAKQYAPDVDILGGLIYQGKTFGNYFERLKRNYGKPNCFIEFGSDRYDSVWQQEAEDWQAFFLKLQWLEIVKNRAGGTGEGNSLGGFVFGWQDEWWKHNPDSKPGWQRHDTGASWANTAYYFDAKAINNMSEEWWGIVGLDPNRSQDGLDRRVPKKAYFVLKELWTGRR